jgi:hypothetical protein
MRKPQVTTLDHIWHSGTHGDRDRIAYTVISNVRPRLSTVALAVPHLFPVVSMLLLLLLSLLLLSVIPLVVIPPPIRLPKKKYCVIFSKAQIPTPPKFLPSYCSIPSCYATQCNASHMLLPYIVHRRLYPQPLYNSPLFLRFALALLSGFQARPHLHGRVEILKKVFSIS